MLKIKIALLAAVGLLLFSCNTKSKEEKSTEIKTEEHQHSKGEAIQLNKVLTICEVHRELLLSWCNWMSVNLNLPLIYQRIMNNFCRLLYQN